MGSATHPRRARNARDRRQPGDGRKVHGEATTSASQTWRTFLTNHVHQIVAADFFVVPTATFRLLFVLLILAHDRRRVMHTAVTAHPTAVWTAQQFREAFPWDQAPAYLIHDRDRAFQAVKAKVDAMGIEGVLTAPRSPWQNSYAERFIGSVRRECLDHVIVLNAAGFRQIQKSYVGYYTMLRTHLSLEKHSPEPRLGTPPGQGRVIAIPVDKDTRTFWRRCYCATHSPRSSQDAGS